MNVDDSLAGFALDVATPMKFAFATLDDRLLVGVVAATATHQQTTVHPRRILVALTPFRPDGT